MIWWLSGLPGGQRPEPLNLPRGHWVVCGKGSFGRYIAAALETAGVTWSFADFDFEEVMEAQKETIMKVRSKC